MLPTRVSTLLLRFTRKRFVGMLSQLHIVSCVAYLRGRLLHCFTTFFTVTGQAMEPSRADVAMLRLHARLEWQGVSAALCIPTAELDSG